MDNSVISLNVRLEAAVRKEGSDWLAWCPSLDVMSQAESQEDAFSALKEAVELWFESCIDRGVLEEALAEAGFHRAAPGEALPSGANVVQVRQQPTLNTNTPTVDEVGTSRGYIEVCIPAYIAAKHMESLAAC